MGIEIFPLAQNLICAWQNFDYPLLAHNHYGLSLTNPTFPAADEIPPAFPGWEAELPLQSVSLLLVSTCLSLDHLEAHDLSQRQNWLLLISWTGWNLRQWWKTKTWWFREDVIHAGCIYLWLHEFQHPHFPPNSPISHHVKLVKKAVLCACCKVLLHFLHCVVFLPVIVC